jgi:hypothetical protein
MTGRGAAGRGQRGDGGVLAIDICLELRSRDAHIVVQEHPIERLAITVLMEAHDSTSVERMRSCRLPHLSSDGMENAS